jgi:hypothetical protein
LIPIAERLLLGEATVPGYPACRVTLPFDSRDLEKGLPGWRLEVASLVVPEILLSAYEATGREQFLFSARDAIRGWASYERGALLPRGFLWNDHALASRVVVLAHFWRLYRRHPSYDPVIGRSVLEFATRCGRRLAAPGQFSFATNHGVLQNLALWHLAVAFPWMPERESLRQIAFQRLQGQMGFYIDSQGVVLEHSAEYQAFGLELLGMALRYLTLMGETPPAEWLLKYEAAKEVYRLMRRPDGTLPLLGDTDSRPEPHVPLVTTIDAEGRAAPLGRRADWNPPVGNWLFADAGYAIWWDGREENREVKEQRQTLMTWSYFPGHGHKHADELSLLLWADGKSWWTNAGYWTYDLPGRTEAVSWTGSNAPHLVGEPSDSPRESRLLGSGESAQISGVDLERRGPGVYVARREIVHLRPDLWLILDQTRGGAGDHTATTWTVSPDVTLVPRNTPGTYLLTAQGARSELRAALYASHGATPRLLRGSVRPFAGWAVRHGMPEPTTSLLLDQDAQNSWAVAVWRVVTGAAVRETASASTAGPEGDGAVEMNYHSPEDWEVTLSPWLGVRSIRREGTRISVRTESRSNGEEAITLAPVPRDSVKIQAIEQGFRRMASAYPTFRDHLPERRRVTGWLAACFLIQELAVLLIRGRRAKLELPLRTAALTAWLVGGIWLVGIYLGT